MAMVVAASTEKYGPSKIARPNGSSATTRGASKAIKRVREVRSTSKPKGMTSNQNGKDWMEANKPISPGPALSNSTATMGTAARLYCSVDCANKLAQASLRNDAERRWSIKDFSMPDILKQSSPAG